MHDNTDDLLQELADLESSDLSGTPSDRPAESDATLPTQEAVLLSATEQAQQAAELAQIAADRTLTLGKEQKESIIEISEALGTWRQASRAALKELQAGHKKMSAMLGITALLGMATLGGGGWIMWQIQKAAESAKADVLDLLQTQLAVFNHKTALKLDELAAVIESLQAELNRLSKESAVAAAHHTGPAPYQAPVTFTTPAPAETPLMPDLAREAHETPHHTASELPHSAAHPAPVHKATAHHQPTAHHTPQTKSQTNTLPVPTAQETSRLKHIEKALAAVHQQLQELLIHQETVHLPHPERGISPAALADIRKVVAEQNRQLKIIRAALWKLRQQTGIKTTPAAQGSLSQLQHAIETLTGQIRQLQAQQEKMRAEIAALKQQTARLAADRPYSYKAPPLNLE